MKSEIPLSILAAFFVVGGATSLLLEAARVPDPPAPAHFAADDLVSGVPLREIEPEYLVDFEEGGSRCGPFPMPLPRLEIVPKRSAAFAPSVSFSSLQFELKRMMERGSPVNRNMFAEFLPLVR